MYNFICDVMFTVETGANRIPPWQAFPHFRMTAGMAGMPRKMARPARVPANRSVFIYGLRLHAPDPSTDTDEV